MDKTKTTVPQTTIEAVNNNDECPVDTYTGMYWVNDGSNRCTTRTIKTTRPTHPSELVTAYQQFANEMGLPEATTRCHILGHNSGVTLTYAEQGATVEQLAEFAGVPKSAHKRAAKVARGFAAC